MGRQNWDMPWDDHPLYTPSEARRLIDVAREEGKHGPYSKEMSDHMIDSLEHDIHLVEDLGYIPGTRPPRKAQGMTRFARDAAGTEIKVGDKMQTREGNPYPHDGASVEEVGEKGIKIRGAWLSPMDCQNLYVVRMSRMSSQGEAVAMALGYGTWYPTDRDARCPLCGAMTPVMREARTGVEALYEHQKPGYSGPCPGPQPGEKFSRTSVNLVTLSRALSTGHFDPKPSGK